MSILDIIFLVLAIIALVYGMYKFFKAESFLSEKK